MHPLEGAAFLHRLRGFLGTRSTEHDLLNACAPLFGQRDRVTPRPELRRKSVHDPYDSDSDADYTIALCPHRQHTIPADTIPHAVRYQYDSTETHLAPEELRDATLADTSAARWVPAGKPAAACGGAVGARGRAQPALSPGRDAAHAGHCCRTAAARE